MATPEAPIEVVDRHLVFIATNGSVTDYVWDKVLALPEVISDSNSVYPHGLNLIARQSGQDTSYLHADGLGSVRKITGSAGQVVGGYSYDAFGAVRQETGLLANNHKFTGEEVDETGLIYLRARYYDRTTGRVISRDPFKGQAANPLSQHPYAYSYNNPVNLTDPSGQVVDTAVDIGFIFYDLNRIMFNNVFGKKDNLGENGAGTNSLAPPHHHI